MKLTPASSALWMIRIDSSWSVSPQDPNIIAPRQSGLTLTPVRPSARSSMPVETRRRLQQPHDQEHEERDPNSDAGDRERRAVLVPEAGVRAIARDATLGRLPGPVVVVPGTHGTFVPRLR